MGRKWLVILTVLLIVCIVGGWYFFAKESRYFGTSPVNAVPVESPMFIRVRDLGDFISKTTRHKGWQSLKGLLNAPQLYNDLFRLDSLVNRNSVKMDFLRKRELIYVPESHTRLYLIPINSLAEKNSIRDFIQDYYQSRKIEVSVDEFHHAEVMKYEWSQNGDDLKNYYSFYRGLLLFSNDYGFLTRSIDQLDRPSVTDDPGFSRINNNAAENIDLNIYVNHKTFPSFLGGTFNDSVAPAFAREEYARWTEVDFIQRENQLHLSGVTVTDSLEKSYMDVFRNQKPVNSSLPKYMPSVTTYFAIQNLSSPVAYFKDYSAFLEKCNKMENYNTQLLSLKKDLNMDVRKFLTDSWLGEASAVCLNFNLEDSLDNRFLLMKMKPGTTALLLASLRKRMNSEKNRLSQEEMEDARERNLFRFPDENFGRLLNEYCFGSVSTTYLVVYEDFMIMGPSPGALKRYLDHLRREDCLVRNTSYQKFSSGIVRASNYYSWCVPGYSYPFFSSVVAPAFYQNLQRNLPSLTKIEHAAWQWGYENGLIYNAANILFNPALLPIQMPLWKYTLTSEIFKKPVFVLFSRGGKDKSVLFQDRNNNLISLDRYGLVNWSLPLEGPVLGEFKIIDLRGKGEFHLLFNTKSAIHLIDRKGTEARNFPVRLRSNAANEVAALDFDGRYDYRFMIACRDRKIYSFDKNGKLVTGWQPKPTTGLVEQPVRHFKSGSRDYLAYFDRNRTYLVDRQGKERLRFREEFIHSGNGLFLLKDSESRPVLLTTDEKGIIRILRPDGTAKKMALGNFSAGHRFFPIVPEDGRTVNYLFADQGKISMFDSEGKLLFSKQTDLQGQINPSLIHGGNEELIELYSPSESKSVYFKMNGKEFLPDLPEDFRILGIGLSSDSFRVANILVRSGDNLLSNFQMFIK